MPVYMIGEIFFKSGFFTVLVLISLPVFYFHLKDFLNRLKEENKRNK